MGNVPTKLDQESNGGRSVNSDTSANVTGEEVRARGKRTTSLVGSILSNNRVRSESNAGKGSRKKSTREKEEQKEDNARKLVIRFDETVDGGYLAPHGCYSLEKVDYDVDIVRKLIIDRKLAPFYIPLQDFDESWTKEEVTKIVDGLPLHAPFNEHVEEYEDVPVGNLKDPFFDHLVDKSLSKKEQRKMHALIFKARLHRKRIQWQESENNAYLEQKYDDRRDQSTTTHKFLPNDELKYELYKNGAECPICFLYIPGPLNYSKCCQQPICTECFVQIKRADPHFPHDEVDPTKPQADDSEKDPNLLISEPSSCPYCATPNFSVTYTPPEERKVGINGQHPNSFIPVTITEREIKNYTVTSDDIRPDWESKLNKERARLARRSANATAIHVSNRLIGPHRTATTGSDDSQSESTSRAGGRSTGITDNALDELERQMVNEAIRLSLQDEKRKRKESKKN
ncbi:Protein SIP5 [Nakaseomyces bracarensis]|uniref:Protein SIP5 n=1 Tax=Nakaseomyces bracarensis TaxID=273131 RepID=A0ABR4NPM1_9SACH